MTGMEYILITFSNSVMQMVADTNSFLNNLENGVGNITDEEGFDIAATMYFIDYLCSIGFPYLNVQEKAKINQLFERVTIF